MIQNVTRKPELSREGNETILTKGQVNDGEIRRFLSYKDTEITKGLIIEFFSNRPKYDANRKFIGVTNPLIYVDDPITLVPDQLPSIKEKTDTTVGRYFFNMFCISSIYGDLLPYFNITIDESALKGIQQTIVDLMLEGKANTEQFGTFQTRMAWLVNFTEIFVPGMTIRLISPLPELMKMKEELVQKYQAEIEAGDYVKVTALIEKVLLEKGKELLKDDPAWSLYQMGGKPSFGNNYKNTNLMVGALRNPITGKYEVSTRSFSEGIDPRQFTMFANNAIFGAYSRAVNTRDGGAMTKYLFAAMQSEVLDEPGTNCQTKNYLTVTINKENKNDFVYQFIVEEGNLVQLMPANINNYLDKTVQLRSPLFCKNPKICSVCAGSLFYSLDIRNIGLTVTKTTSTLLNLALKNMHDTTIKTFEFDPFKYLSFAKE